MRLNESWPGPNGSKGDGIVSSKASVDGMMFRELSVAFSTGFTSPSSGRFGTFPKGRVNACQPGRYSARIERNDKPPVITSPLEYLDRH